MPKRQIATIPEPYENLHSLFTGVSALKELVEGLTGQRGTLDDRAVTWGDLVRLGLIQSDQVKDV